MRSYGERRSAADVIVRKVRLRKEEVGRQKFFCWDYVMLLGMLSLSGTHAAYPVIAMTTKVLICALD